MYTASMRIVKCEKCGMEINVRSNFAYITLANHNKVCKSS
jgi:hypothetical protein